MRRPLLFPFIAIIGLFFPTIASAGVPPVSSASVLYSTPMLTTLAVQAESPPQFLLKWGSFGTGDGQFTYISDIAVDQIGNVYVAGDERIQKFTNNGVFITTWGFPGSGDGEFSGLDGITVDGSGNVYTAETSNRRVQKFTSSGTFLTKWGTPGSGDGEFQGPVDVAVDSNGNVFVAEFSNVRIQKFDSAGTFLTKWGTLGSADGEFNRPIRIAVDADGNVYVTDQGNARVQKFDNNGGFVTKWGTSGTEDGQLWLPIGIAVDENTDVFVAELINSRVQKFDSNGVFLTKWGTSGTDDGQFDRAVGVAVDGNGNVFVTDDQTPRIQKFGFPLHLTLDIHPASCPNPLSVNKQGVIPAAILGTEDFDVHDIDLPTVLLEGVTPKRSNFQDVAAPFEGELCGCTEEGPDGFEDLTLKFMAPAILEALMPVMHGEERVLTLTGNLLDGTPFEASDCMVIRGGPKDAIAPAPGSEAEDEDDPDTDTGTEAEASFGLFTNNAPSQRIQRITYKLPEESEVRLIVYDVSGRVVKHLVQSVETRGLHAVEWDTSTSPSGIYFLRLEAGLHAKTQKLLVVH